MKEHKDNKDEFSTLFSDKNYLSPSSSTTKELHDLSDTESELIKVVTTIVAKITQEKSRKKQKTEHSFYDHSNRYLKVGSFVTAIKIKTKKVVTGILTEETGNFIKIKPSNGETNAISKEENWIQI